MGQLFESVVSHWMDAGSFQKRLSLEERADRASARGLHDRATGTNTMFDLRLRSELRLGVGLSNRRATLRVCS